MSASSFAVTVCRVLPGRTGRTVRANSVFRVLAGGSLRCASCAASTSPVPASATSQDSAVRSGSSGASRCGLTWVPSPKRTEGSGTAAWGAPGGAGAAVLGWAAATVGVRVSMPATQRAQADTANREEGPISI